MSRPLLCAALLAGTLSSPALAAPIVPPPVSQAQPVDAEASFAGAYRAFEHRDHGTAAVGFLGYMSGHSRDDERYEWAEFFLGICFQEMGFSHAAVDTLAELVMQKPNTRIVSFSLELLEQVSRTQPFDRERVLLDVLCEQEYGFVAPELADFVHYHQGLYDWEHGYTQWGNDHFRQLRPGTYYHHKYLYQKALYLIDQDQLAAAAEILDQLSGDGQVDATLRDELHITLARVRYEQEQWQDSEVHYAALTLPEQEQARYLLERAWAHYRMGRPEKAMGLLYAFEAPSFWRHFTPEYYVLKSLIYKNVCHYREALAVVEQFNAKYGDSLVFVRDRGDVLDSDALLLVLLEKPRVQRLYRFMTLLDGERARIDSLSTPELAAHLERIYSLQIEQTRRQLRETLDAEYELLATRLLEFQEQVHLLEYEIGLDMYQRVADYHYTEPPESPAADPAPTTAFAFQGEFWNDELDDYQVVLEDRCESAQEWDIFFQ